MQVIYEWEAVAADDAWAHRFGAGHAFVFVKICSLTQLAADWPWDVMQAILSRYSVKKKILEIFNDFLQNKLNI